MNSSHTFDPNHFCQSWCQCCEENMRLKLLDDSDSPDSVESDDSQSELYNSEHINKKRSYDEMING